MTPISMSDLERQIVEQNVALTKALADMNTALVLRLVNFGALSEPQALATLSDLAGYAKEAATRNAQFSGMQTVFQGLSDHLHKSVADFQAETGTTWEAARQAVEKNKS